MKINVKPGQLLTFNEIPAEYGTDECLFEFRGQVLSVFQEQNLVEVLVLARCLCNEANCAYNPHDVWGAWNTIFFDLDGSTWNLDRQWKRECEDIPWIESEMEAQEAPEDHCKECANLRMQLKDLQEKYNTLQYLSQH